MYPEQMQDVSKLDALGRSPLLLHSGLNAFRQRPSTSSLEAAEYTIDPVHGLEKKLMAGIMLCRELLFYYSMAQSLEPRFAEPSVLSMLRAKIFGCGPGHQYLADPEYVRRFREVHPKNAEPSLAGGVKLPDVLQRNATRRVEHGFGQGSRLSERRVAGRVLNTDCLFLAEAAQKVNSGSGLPF